MKKYISIILCLALFFSLSITAFAASGEDYAYVYGFDYNDGAVDTTEISAQQQM